MLASQFLAALSSAPAADEPHEMVAVHNISFMDDASAKTWDRDAEGAVRTVGATVAIHHETFLSHALRLNFAEGKSGCLLALRGANTKGVRERASVKNQTSLDVEDAEEASHHARGKRP